MKAKAKLPKHGLVITSAKMDPARHSEIVDRVSSALRGVNGASSSFAITSYAQIRDICERAAIDLEDRGLSPRQQIDVTVCYSPRGPWAKAYGYTANGTYIECKRIADGWRLTKIEPQELWPRKSETMFYSMHERHKSIIINHALRNCLSARNPQ